MVTESGHPPPPDYHQSFTQLVQLGILDREFAQRLAACAGLRNRIAHEYDEIDPRKVHAALQTVMEDIPAYLRRIDDYLARA